MSNRDITNLSRIHGKPLKLSRPQSKIMHVKCDIRNKSVILNIFLIFNDPPSTVYITDIVVNDGRKSEFFFIYFRKSPLRGIYTSLTETINFVL